MSKKIQSYYMTLMDIPLWQERKYNEKQLITELVLPIKENYQSENSLFFIFACSKVDATNLINFANSVLFSIHNSVISANYVIFDELDSERWSTDLSSLNSLSQESTIIMIGDPQVDFVKFANKNSFSEPIDLKLSLNGSLADSKMKKNLMLALQQKNIL